MISTLSNIGNEINKENITWGIGGSLLLHFYGILNHPNDIDILVYEDDAIKLTHILSSFGNSKEAIHRNPFCTTYFFKYSINHIDLDLMGGFKLEHNEGIYSLLFNQDSIVSHHVINGVNIPLCSLEDWYVLYLLMPNREEKVKILEYYFERNGVTHFELLEKALKQPLPKGVRGKVEGLLK
jgi:hypothetical protein